MWRGLWGFYGIADNAHKLGVVFNSIRMSCVLTLALKLKLETRAAVFNKYGRNLSVTNNGKIIAKFIGRPSFVRKKLNGSPNLDPLNRLEGLSRATFRSRAVFDLCCSLCGSTEKIQMHHVKHIKTLKVKGKLDY